MAGFLQAWAAAALPQVRRRRPRTSSRRDRWTDFIKTGQVDAGVLEEGGERSQADKLASIDGIVRRSEAVACDSGSCGRRRCRWRMKHTIVATTSVQGVGSYVFRYVCIQICVYPVRYLFRYVKVVF